MVAVASSCLILYRHLRDNKRINPDDRRECAKPHPRPTPICRHSTAIGTRKDTAAVVLARGAAGRRLPSSQIPASSPRCCDLLLQTTAEEDLFYTGCRTAKNCFGSPAGCTRSKNCRAAVAVTVRGDQYVFELQALGKDTRYVAVGLSDDKNMVIATDALKYPGRAFCLRLCRARARDSGGNLHNPRGSILFSAAKVLAHRVRFSTPSRLRGSLCYSVLVFGSKRATPLRA